jgi:hypothetical protein
MTRLLAKSADLLLAVTASVMVFARFHGRSGKIGVELAMP